MFQHSQHTLQRQRLVSWLQTQGINSPTVLQAMNAVPREVFIPPALQHQAYDNLTLPIGRNQTISLPSEVARMTQALQLDRHHKVLEIGTGCGYQAAILAKIGRRVFSIERHAALLPDTQQRFVKLGLSNVICKAGDGTLGWPEQAPFDRIIVTAAGLDVPQTLLDQLKDGGICVAPLGEYETTQQLVRLTKQGGELLEEKLGTTHFVPLVGQHGTAKPRTAA